ncbi:Hypothetical protein NocV09_00500340 [Nannochloropsis oceanica]
MYGISNLQDLVGLVKEKGSELAAEGKLFADRLSLDRLQEEGGGQAARAGGGKSSGTSAVSQENFLPPRPDIYSAAAVARAREMNVIAAAPSRPSPLPSSLPPARPAPLPPPSIAAEEGKRGNGNAGGRSGRREEEDNEDENDPIMAAIRGGREGGRKGGREEEEEEEVDVEAAVAESLAFLNKKQPAAGAGVSRGGGGGGGGGGRGGGEEEGGKWEGGKGGVGEWAGRVRSEFWGTVGKAMGQPWGGGGGGGGGGEEEEEGEGKGMREEGKEERRHLAALQGGHHGGFFTSLFGFTGAGGGGGGGGGSSAAFFVLPTSSSSSTSGRQVMRPVPMRGTVGAGAGSRLRLGWKMRVVMLVMGALIICHLECVRARVGHKNIAGSWSWLADVIFKGLKWSIVTVFLDDICVFSKTTGNYMRGVALVLDTLIEEELTVSPEYSVSDGIGQIDTFGTTPSILS